MDDKGRGFDSRHLHLIMALTCGNAAIGVELHSRILLPRESGDPDVSGDSVWPIWRQIGVVTGPTHPRMRVDGVNMTPHGDRRYLNGALKPVNSAPDRGVLRPVCIGGGFGLYIGLDL